MDIQDILTGTGLRHTTCRPLILSHALGHRLQISVHKVLSSHQQLRLVNYYLTTVRQMMLYVVNGVSI